MAYIAPSLDQWLEEAKSDPQASKVGMYLAHNGVVRSNNRAGEAVSGMSLTYDKEMLEAATEEARKLPGVFYVRVWINEGELDVGDDIMKVLVGGDIRDNTFDALKSFVGKIKSEIVHEDEQH